MQLAHNVYVLKNSERIFCKHVCKLNTQFVYKYKVASMRATMTYIITSKNKIKMFEQSFKNSYFNWSKLNQNKPAVLSLQYLQEDHECI